MITRAGIALLLVLAMCAGGCSSAQRAAGPDITGGLRLEMFVQRDAGSFAFYRVTPDGTIAFGGGRDAQDRETSWSGPLTAEEIDRLNALIDEHRWLAARPVSTASPPDRLYEVRVTRGGARQRFTVRGDADAVVPVYELLSTAAQRRLKGDLDALPRPGQQR